MDPSIEDYMRIMQLYALYARAIDTGDGESRANCYAENAGLRNLPQTGGKNEAYI